MNIVVKSEFRDIRDFSVVHRVGDVIDVDEERAQYLVSRGLACEVTPEPTSTKKQAKVKANDD